MNPYVARLQALWSDLYGSSHFELLDLFLEDLQRLKAAHFTKGIADDTTWYQEAIVYSAYAHLFNRDLPGLQEKLPYLQDLGVTCLWLLPILESPMQDAGFDISDFDAIRSDLLRLPPEASRAEKDRVFAELLADLRQRGMRLIFDIAINHTSREHPWFQEARQSKHSPRRAYYIWSDTPDTYPQARLLMKGIHDSNWAFDSTAGQYYLHRFFDIQPDLNYRNPEVLLEMTRMLIRWKMRGVDGFRADAAPFLWKEDNTTCESLPPVHTIIKFFRAALDYLQPGTLLLAEACQPPNEVVAYFGAGDECQAAYHFPVMPRIFRALAEEESTAIRMAMDPAFTPPIPPTCQWFMFLRCHDELSLEMVTPEERTFLYNFYTKDPRWNYRQGEGISARLANLFNHDLRKIRLAYSIMLTLTGTPIIYYGDEFARDNDEAFYQDLVARTGYPDSRYFVRGPIDWERVESDLHDATMLASQVYHTLRTMIRVRKAHPAFSRGALVFIRCSNPDGAENAHILAYDRIVQSERCTVWQNLSAQEQRITMDRIVSDHDLLGQPLDVQNETLVLPAYSWYWMAITVNS